MKTSENAINKIREFEGVSLRAYKPVATEKYYTIGYGHCGADVRKDAQISVGYALFLLRIDLAYTERGINALNLKGLTQSQFDALVSFTFNLGIKKLQESTLLKKIRAGSPTAEIQKEFKRWVYAGGVILRGLQRRREWEAEQWAAE